MSIAAFLAGVDRILMRAHDLYPADGPGASLPTSGGGSAPASPDGTCGLRTGVTRAAGSYQQARTSAARLDQELQQAAEQGGAIGAQGRLGSGVIRNQARAVAAAGGPMAKSPAGARLFMAAMDQHLSAMQGQLRTTKTQNQAVSTTLRHAAAGYRTLSNGAKDSPTDPTIRAAGWKPGDPVPATPGLPPVATDPRNPFIGDPRFGYWQDYVPPPYTGSTPPPAAKQRLGSTAPRAAPPAFTRLVEPGSVTTMPRSPPISSSTSSASPVRTSPPTPRWARVVKCSAGSPTPTRRKNSKT